MRIEQADARAIAARLIAHRLLESTVGHEYQLPWLNRNPFVLKRKPSRRDHCERMSKRAILSEAQNHRCCYCGIRTTATGETVATIEHVVPRSRGGSDVLDNLVMACKRCNQLRCCENAYDFFERRGWITTTTKPRSAE